MKNFCLGFLLATFSAIGLAQINSNDAVYGRLLGTGVGTWLVTPSSANLAAAITDKTGSGAAVFAISPALTTPDLGTPSALTLDNAQIATAVAIGSLPTCNAGNNLKIRVVTDALAPALGSVIAAGGVVKVGVVCVNGTGWLPL